MNFARCLSMMRTGGEEQVHFLTRGLKLEKKHYIVYIMLHFALLILIIYKINATRHTRLLCLKQKCKHNGCLEMMTVVYFGLDR